MFLDHTAVVPWDTILHDMGMKTFLHAQVQCLEWMQMVVYQEASRRAGKPITQGINIWDMKGLTLAKFTAKVREISSATSRIAQDNYPESLAAAYVVNAPSYFTVIWAVIKSFLDPKTVAKVHIYGSGPKMFAKLKNALGPGCFIAEDMVCCKKSQVGAAELTMGLQSAMAASQTWIRERRESGTPGTRRPRRSRRRSTAPATTRPQPPPARYVSAQGVAKGALREDGHRTRSQDRDWDDETFFDAEDDVTMLSSFTEEARSGTCRNIQTGTPACPGGPPASAPASARTARPASTGGCAPIGRRRTRRARRTPSSRRRTRRRRSAVAGVAERDARRNEDCSASGDAWKCDALDSYRQG